MSIEQEQCAEAGEYCGTPAGWRRGGRCWRCRTAHNAETNRYRGLRDDERRTVLAALRAGATLASAAAASGKSAISVSQSAGRDGELRTAIDGQPVENQRLARKGDFLAALTRTGGDRDLAAYVTNVDIETVDWWREEDKRFAATEDAMLRWVTSASKRSGQQGRRYSDAEMDTAAQLLEQGHSIQYAAMVVGATSTTLRKRAAAHQRLAAALPPPRGVKGPGRVSRLCEPGMESKVRELWADRTLSQQTIATRLGVTGHTLRVWARELELPSRATANDDK